MDPNQLRQTLQRKLAQLDFDFSRFTLESFARCIEAQRGRRIEFVPTNFPPGYYGAWISAKSKPIDYLCYHEHLPPLHQAHVQLHELAHLICGHKTVTLTNRQMKQLLANGGDLSAVLCRSNKLRSAEDEQEAETMARLIYALAENQAERLKPASSSVAGKSYLAIFCDRELA